MPNDRRHCLTDKSGEIVCGVISKIATGDIAEHILQHPTADDAVVRQDDVAIEHADLTHKTPFFAQALESTYRVFAGVTAHSHFCHHYGKAHYHNEDQIHQNKGAAAVSACQIREFPNVPQTDGRTCCRQHKS